MKKLSMATVVIASLFALAGCQDRVIWDSQGKGAEATQDREIWNSNGEMTSDERRKIWQTKDGREVIK